MAMQHDRQSRVPSALVAALCCAVVATAGGADVLREDFRYKKDLRPPAEVRHKVASFEIDEEIYSEVDDLSSGLRLYADDGAEVPFIVRRKEKRTTVVRETTIGTKIESFDKRPDGSVEIIVSREKSLPPVHELSLGTELRNFEKQVTVYGGNDGEDWELLAEKQPVFDYSRYLDLRNTRIDLTPSRFVCFRVVVSAIEEAQQSPFVRIVRDSRGGESLGEQEHLSFTRVDFRIEKIALIGHVEEKRAAGPALRAYTVTNVVVEADDEKQRTVVVFETARAPISELTIETESVNFTRPVVVDATDADEGDDWQRLTSARISRIEVGAFRRDERRVSLGRAHRFRRYRLSVRNDNSPPIKIDGVAARGEVREGVFFVPEGDLPAIHYAGGELPRPKYDIAGVLGRVPFADTDLYVPGSRRANEVFSGDTCREPMDTKILLIAAILATVVVLGWLIARTSGKLQPEGE